MRIGTCHPRILCLPAFLYALCTSIPPHVNYAYILTLLGCWQNWNVGMYFK